MNACKYLVKILIKSTTKLKAEDFAEPDTKNVTTEEKDEKVQPKSFQLVQVLPLFVNVLVLRTVIVVATRSNTAAVNAITGRPAVGGSVLPPVVSFPPLLLQLARLLRRQELADVRRLAADRREHKKANFKP